MMDREDKLYALFKESRKAAPTDMADLIMGSLPEPQPLPEALKQPILKRWVLVLIALLVGLGLATTLYFAITSGTGTSSNGQIEEYTNGFAQLTNSLFANQYIMYTALILPLLGSFMALDRILKKKFYA